MRRTALALAVFLVGVGAAQAQTADWWKLSQAEREALLQVAPSPRKRPRKPPIPPDLEGLLLALSGANAVKTIVVITNDVGGYLDQYEAKWREIAANGNPVEIRGMCQSACTMITGIVPKERICVGGKGYLSFHQAQWHGNPNRPSPSGTRWMYDHYSPEVQGWITAKGGVEKMSCKDIELPTRPYL